MAYERISVNIPSVGESLARYSGSDVIEKIGYEAIREVTASVLCGGNVRALTEGLTRRRTALANAALFVMFLRSADSNEDFLQQIPEIVQRELRSGISPEKKLFLQWCIGLTGKSIQNVLRSDLGEFESYLGSFNDSLKQAIRQCDIDYGELQGVIKLPDLDVPVDWPFILYLFAAIGSQTLTIRGSEKSMYGKLFEKLVLGSVLTIFGFDLVDPTDATRTEKVFWLSERGDKRESDATLLFAPGVGVRFDVGFIGPGNTEISLDKVSRFEREIEYGSQSYYMTTIILVDRIGDRSRITQMAREIDGEIVQMSMAFWVKEVARVLNERIGFEHRLLELSNDESLEYIRDAMLHVPLKHFS